MSPVSKTSKSKYSSRLTEKFQATVPLEVRKVLKVDHGDRVAFEILEDGTVILRRALPLDVEWASEIEGTLEEWASQNDEKAYGDL